MSESVGIVFNLLVIRDEKLVELFSKKDFTNLFQIRYVETVTEILSILDQEAIPDTIILDETTALSHSGMIFTQIKEQIVLRNALNDSVGLTNPVIVIQNDSDDVETTEKLYAAGATDSYPITINHSRLAAKLRHLSEHFYEEQNRIACSTGQQRDTIKNLVQINKKTGVYNKTTFLAKTRDLLRNSPDTKYVVIVLNFDRFKVFNDMFGFDEGDKVLEKIGKFLNGLISKNTIVGHIYADHFVLCTKENSVTPDIISAKSSDFIKTLHPNFDFIARFGIYQLRSNNEDVSLACDRAELALNSIKQSFNERVAYYDDSMIQNLKQEQELISDMVSGLQNKEFKVFLQPQYDYTTSSLVGAEALVRWQHPEKGLISPAIFIPLFERNGFISQLDKYVWEETCRLMRNWMDKGLNPVPVSVNISRRDIYNLDLMKIFDNLLKKYDLTPRNLRLEITESAYMDNPEQLIQVVQNLRNRGFCLEMDDFGSGYSSLNTLKEVPVDILKLDMKFIAAGTLKSGNSEEDEKGGSILSSVVRMANWLHLPVIAEGIESKEQADYLKSIGCFHMQGFYFAKPMPSEQYENLLCELKPEGVNFQEPEISSEALKFLNASSQATLLFNSFVGGAAIIEWTGENIEVLRMNDQYLEEIGTTRDSYFPAMKDFLSSIDENSRTVFMTTLSTVTRTERPSFCEVMMKPFDEDELPFWVRIHMRHLGKTVTSNIYYISVENINFRMQLLQVNTNLSEQLSAIMENLPCGIMNLNFINNNVRASYTNEIAAKLLDYNPTEFKDLIQDDPLIFFHEDDREYVRNYIKTAIEDNLKTFHRKARVICKNGNFKKVQFAGTVNKCSDGNYTINIIFVDIDEQETKSIQAYTEVMFSIFSEVFEINYESNTSRTIRADYAEDFKDPVKPLDKTLEAWITKCVFDEYQDQVKEFFTLKNIEAKFKNGFKVPYIEYDFKAINGDRRRLSTTVIKIPMETSTYLVCNSTLPKA